MARGNRLGTNYRFTPKRKIALRKAQAVSAKNRRGKRQPLSSGKKKAIAAVGVIAVGAVATTQGRKFAKESALKHKYGTGYIPPKLTGYHFTYKQHQRDILKNQKFKVKDRHHPPGIQKHDEIWFTTGAGKKDRRLMEFEYGKYAVKVKVKRSELAQHHKGYASNPGHKAWFSVKQSTLKGKRIRRAVTPKSNNRFGNVKTLARARRVNAAKRVRSKARFATNSSGVTTRSY